MPSRSRASNSRRRRASHKAMANMPLSSCRKSSAVFLVEMDDHLGVGMVGGEPVAGALSSLAQFDVVVDLAVEDDRDGPVLVEHRLLAGGHVDDGQPAHAERHARPFPDSRPRPGPR